MIYFVTLAFGPGFQLRRSLQRLKETRNPDLPFRHVLVDQHYPLDRDNNAREIREIAAEFGLEVMDPGENLGLHRGFNWAMKQLGMQSGDKMICYDPDASPITPGWDMALVRAIEGDPQKRVVWATLMDQRIAEDLEQKGYDRRVSDGYIDLWIPKRPVMNGLCCFDVDWLLKVGGLHEPRPFYGHLEGEMFWRLGDKQWAHLPGWIQGDELRGGQDWQYVAYKWCHSLFQTFDGDFASYLEAGCPIPAKIPRDHHLFLFIPPEELKKYM